MQAIPAAALAAVRTSAVQRALSGERDRSRLADLLFLELWEREPIPGAAAALRVYQIRRANPELAAELRAELHRGRPLTPEERAALSARLPGGGADGRTGTALARGANSAAG